MWNTQFFVKKLLGLLMGLILAYAVTLAGILILSMGLYKWNMSVHTAEIGILILYFLSCFLGGIFAGKKAESKKFLWGLLLGFCYFLVLLLFSLTGENGISSGWKEIILPALMCLFSGMLGGMLV